jgi:ankyrin repeat protein
LVVSLIEMHDLDTILHHLGIDPSENTLDIICQLMNCTLQCLGGIRQLFEKLEKERIAQQITAIEEANRFNEQAMEYQSLKRAFSYATDRMSYEINRSQEIHNLNPSRHLVESFPCSESYLKKEWCSAHWTILGDTRFEEVNCSVGEHDHTKDTHEEQIIVLDHLSAIMPTSFQETDKEHRSVLHFAARLDSVSLFENVLRNCQKVKGYSVKDANHNGALPLHNTARFSKSLPVFLRVEEEYKEALTAKNHEGMMPLHWAAAKNHSVEIVQHLIETYPASIRIPNEEGYLPLHLAGQNDCLEVVKLIYSAFPEAIRVHDSDGGLPIHHACSLSKNIEVIKFLYEQYPESILQAQDHGITPLHLAASQNDFPELFRFILSKSPRSLFIRDSVNCLPMDCLTMRFKYGIDEKLLSCFHVLLSVSTAVEQENQKNFILPSSEEIDNIVTDNDETTTSSSLSCDCDILFRNDNVTRVYLSQFFPNHPQLRMLNKAARKLSVLFCVRLSKMTDLGIIKEGRESFVNQMVMHHAKKVLLMKRNSSDFTTLAENDYNLFVVLTRLCQKFMSPESNEIPSGILRIVITFL